MEERGMLYMNQRYRYIGRVSIIYYTSLILILISLVGHLGIELPSPMKTKCILFKVLNANLEDVVRIFITL